MGANPHTVPTALLSAAASYASTASALLDANGIGNVLQDVPVIQAHHIFSKLRQGLSGPLDIVIRDAPELPSGVSSISQLYELVQRHQGLYFSVVSMFALVIYDYMLTLNMEVEFIWKSKSRFSAMNCLFFSNRYIPIIRCAIHLIFSFSPPSTPRKCGQLTDLNSWLTMVAMANVEILMLTRAWALYGKSRKIGFLLIGAWLLAVFTCGVIIRAPLPPIHGVVPIEPIAINPCDRPGPYKYMASYVIGLALELFSFSMMMGRIAYLSKRTKASNSSRRTAALPILQALQRHGAYYFAAVIFSMAFTVGAAFSKPLARTVVNSGMAVNLTSIACNRVIFAFRGLYLDFNTDNLRSRPIPPPSNRGKSVDDAERSLPDNGVMSTDVDAYEDEYIAYTRHDMTTRDLGSRDEGQSDRASEKVPSPPLPTTLFTFPVDGKRPRQSKFPFHSHHGSTSSNLTRDSSREPGTNESKQARQNRSLSPSSNSQSPLVPIPATIAATTSDSIQITKATSPTSLKSMARGVLKSPPMSPISPAFGRVSESSNGEGGRPRQGTEKTLFPSSPPSLEHVRQTPSSSGTKRHSFWWTCPGSKGSGGADALSIAERAGMGNEGDWRDGPDAGVGASGTSGGREGVMEISSRPRGRERHPLDHQYEMETLYIDSMDRVLGTQDDDHD